MCNNRSVNLSAFCAWPAGHWCKLNCTHLQYVWFWQALFKIKTCFHFTHIFLTRHSRKLKLNLFPVKPGHEAPTWWHCFFFVSFKNRQTGAALKPFPSVSSHPPLYRDCCALAWWSIKTSVSKHLHISFSKKVFFFSFLTQPSCFFFRFVTNLTG